MSCTDVLSLPNSFMKQHLACQLHFVHDGKEVDVGHCSYAILGSGQKVSVMSALCQIHDAAEYLLHHVHDMA